MTIIGQGNVSLDVARMLLLPPSRLAHHDVPASVLSVLERSAVEHVSIVGRRGPLQAAFTTKELREMISLPDAAMAPLDPAVLQAEGTPTRQQARTLDLLRRGSKNAWGTTRKTWSLDFFRSPTGLDAPSAPGDRATLHLARTRLDARQRAVPTGEEEYTATDLVVTALGHRAEDGAPWLDAQAGHVRAERGRVLDAEGRVVRGAYASGWAAMGARGVIASTMMDAFAVAETILRDALPGAWAAEGREAEAEGREETVLEGLGKGDVGPDAVPPDVEAGVRDGRVTQFPDWFAVNAEEIMRGEAMGKERERMVWEEARDFLARRKAAVSS